MTTTQVKATTTFELLPEHVDILLEALAQVQLDRGCRLELDEALLEQWSWYDSDTPIHYFVTQGIDSCYRVLKGLD